MFLSLTKIKNEYDLQVAHFPMQSKYPEVRLWQYKMW